MHTKEEKLAAFAEALEIMETLRAKCPWNAAQTTESLRPMTVEEVYELSDAVLRGDDKDLRKELGDVLLHIIFYARIAEEEGRWDIADVIHGLCEKMRFRHPHVFGSAHEDSPESVLVSWDKLKRQEKGQATVTDTLNSVARSLPGLWRAEKIQNKAAKAGFDWPDINGALDKLDEETGELRRAVENGEGVAEELGDVLFATVKAARFAGVDPEEAIAATCEKFIRRFRAVEEGAARQGRSLDQLSLDEMTALWDGAKGS